LVFRELQMKWTPCRRAGLAVLTVLFIGWSGCGPGGNTNNGTAEVEWQQAFDASDSGWLLSVAGSSPSNVYAVGGTPEQGRIWHFDGVSWSEQDVPEDVPLLNWVHVFDDDSAVIAGNDGTILRRRNGAWIQQATTTDQDLWGVWGASDAQIWAVGGNGRDGDEATVLVSRSDGAWKQQTLPEFERPNVRAFFKVWGASGDDVYIVGQHGAVVHWNGDQFQELLVGTSEDLISVWGTGPDNVVAVGGRSNGVVAHFDGSKWATESLAPTPGINGVWLVDPDTAWVAGNSGTLGRLDLTDMTLERDDVATGLDVHAVFGIEDLRFAVGGNFGTPQGPYHGVSVQQDLTP
jgi:hypothetical protein